MDNYFVYSGENTLRALLKYLAQTYIEKVEGKGLSTCDFTDEEKEKLSKLFNYSLPVASDDTLGGIKVGDGLIINDGMLALFTGATNSEEWTFTMDDDTTVTKNVVLLPGRLSWKRVLKSIEAGTYATDYAIGECVQIYLGDEGVVNAQIAGFDVDLLADGSGYAAITWITKELLTTSQRINPSLVTNEDGTYKNGTGSIGGWEYSEMRSYLKDTVKQLLPKNIANAIVTVQKNQLSYDTAGESYTQTTDDDVWIPSYDEVVGSGSTYYALFENKNTNLIKYKPESSSADIWWLRSAGNNKEFRTVSVLGGDTMSYEASETHGVSVGFCTGRGKTIEVTDA